MSFEIYEPDLSNRYELTHALSIRTSVLYNGIGKFTMILPIDAYNINAVKNNAIVLDLGSMQTFIVESVQTDTINNQLVVNGYTSNAILNRRVVANDLTVTNLEAGAYALVADNLRGLPGVILADPKGFSESEVITVHGGQLLDQMIALLAAGGLGHRFVWNYRTKAHTLEIYKGNDLTQGIHSVAFSYERGTAKDLVITDDQSTLKNVFYVTGRTTSDQVIMEILGDATGGDRYEKWIKEEVRQGSDETETQLRERMRGVAAETVSDYLRRQNFEIVIDPSDYGDQYKLGDIVTCISTTFGVRFKTRITGISYNLDINGTKTSLTLGEPNLTIMEEVRLNG